LEIAFISCAASSVDNIVLHNKTTEYQLLLRTGIRIVFNNCCLSYLKNHFCDIEIDLRTYFYRNFGRILLVSWL